MFLAIVFVAYVLRLRAEAPVKQDPPAPPYADPGKAGFTVFVSAATTDFPAARGHVAQVLEDAGFRVIEQSRLQYSGIDTLLDDLRECICRADVVVALIGARSGSQPEDQPAARHAWHRPAALPQPSHTQWEVLLARSYGIPICYVTQRGLVSDDAVQDACQSPFLAFLKASGHPRHEYDSPTEIPRIALRWVEQRYMVLRGARGPVPLLVTRHLSSLRSFALDRLGRIARDRIPDSREIGLRFAARRFQSPDAAEPDWLPAALLRTCSVHANDPNQAFERIFVVAEAGDGKTTLVQWLIAEAADEEFVRRTRMTPILADCVTLARLMTASDAEDESMIDQWLRIAVSPGGQWSHIGSRHVEDFLEEIRSCGLKLLIVVDGLDELNPSGVGTDRAQRLFQALEAWRVRQHVQVDYFATSRRGAAKVTHDPFVRAAATVRLQPVELLRASDHEVRTLARHQCHSLGSDEALLGRFVAVFQGPSMEAKFVYFHPLIRFFQRHPDRARQGEITNLELMQAETAQVIESIREDLVERQDELTADPGLDAQIAHVLLDIAMMSLSRFDTGLPMSLSRQTLEIRLSAIGHKGLADLVAEEKILLSRLLHILVYVSRDAGNPPDAFYRLPHNEYRDYLLADGIYRWIQGDPLIGQAEESFIADLACSYLGAQRVRVFLNLIIADRLGPEGSPQRLQFARALATRMNLQLINREPAERTDASPHGAMLSLLVSLGPIPATADVEAAGRCFQGAVIPQQAASRTALPLRKDARGASFVEADLRGADLSGRDFSGANFDNARLNGASLAGSDFTGANLRNVAMGGFRYLPTDLTGAVFAGSDWFNYRFQDLNGFFHFWDLETLPSEAEPDRWILASGSGGQILTFDRIDAARPPIILQTGHVNEVMDLSFHPQRRVLISTSRDRTVRLASVEAATTTSAGVSLREITSLQLEKVFRSDDYPRRAQFGASDEWIAVIARDPRVAFFPIDKDGHAGEPVVGYGHTGPVMCVVADQETLINAGPNRPPDTFLTAGYDGRVAVWRENATERNGHGWSKPLSVAETPVTTSKGRTEIFRALAHGAAQNGLWAGTELESRLLWFQFDGEAVLQRFEIPFPDDGGVFALALNEAPPRIAVGSANGRVRVFEATGDASAGSGPQAYDWENPVLDAATNGEIVRALRFLEGGSRLVAATWDACLFWFDLDTRRMVHSYEFPAAGWRPEVDCGQIVFAWENSPLVPAQGLSERMKDYLVLVNRMRLDGNEPMNTTPS